MKHYKMMDVVSEISERENSPSTSGYDRFVGLEHYVSGEVEITNYGSTANLDSAMKVFHAGDILVARRNVYLKRASVVFFDGLTSGDSIVLRAKNDRIARLLPFVLNTDAFWDYADQYSDGTMSKRLSPKTLMQYEFDLPDEDQQDQLADTLWAAAETKASYQHLLTQTDELVKSQFIEISGDPALNPMGWRKAALKELCKNPDDIKCGPFGTQLAKEEYKSEGIPLWGIPQVNSAFSIPTKDYLTEEKAQKLAAYSAIPGDIVMSRKGNVGMCALYPPDFPLGIIHSDVLRIRVDHSIADPHFLMCQLHFSQDVQNQIANVSNGAIMAGVNVTKLKTITVLLPDLDVQKKFISFVEQTDKSKFELNQAIQSVSGLIKSLMQQDFSN